MLKTKEILDEKDKRLRLISEEVTFPLTKEDKELIDKMVTYLHDSQIEKLAKKYDLRPGMGMAAIQLGVPKRYLTIVHEVAEQEFDTYVICNPKIISNSEEKIYVDMGEGCLSINRDVEGIVPRYARVTVEGYDIDGNKKYDGTIVNGDFSVSKSGAISASYDKDISGNDFVFGANYYTLKVYAVTTDLHRKLELYNDVIKQVSTDKIYMDVAELRNPSITVNKQEAIISEDYKHSIKYKITVIDSNRVITDGKYYIELQDTSYKNVCSNPKDCQVTVDMKNNTCTFGNGKSCTVNPVNDGLVVEVTFDNLKADTNYVIYAYADVYRNNVSLNDSEKLSKVYVRKSQYTKSDLGFSLGAVTPTAVSKKEVHLTFVGAANLNEKIKGIEYSITVQGGERIASGVIGKTTNTSSDEITFKLDSDRYPYLDIAIPDGKELGVNNTINITYYYLDNDGTISVLKLGDKTTFDYSFKNENK